MGCIFQCWNLKYCHVSNHRIPTTDSQREARLRAALRSADLLGPEERAERRAKARAKKKEMERERKKAIRAAYRRVKEAKRKKEPEVNLTKCLR